MVQSVTYIGWNGKVPFKSFNLKRSLIIWSFIAVTRYNSASEANILSKLLFLSRIFFCYLFTDYGTSSRHLGPQTEDREEDRALGNL